MGIKEDGRIIVNNVGDINHNFDNLGPVGKLLGRNTSSFIFKALFLLHVFPERKKWEKKTR